MGGIYRIEETDDGLHLVNVYSMRDIKLERTSDGRLIGEICAGSYITLKESGLIPGYEYKVEMFPCGKKGVMTRTLMGNYEYKEIDTQKVDSPFEAGIGTGTTIGDGDDAFGLFIIGAVFAIPIALVLLIVYLLYMGFHLLGHAISYFWEHLLPYGCLGFIAALIFLPVSWFAVYIARKIAGTKSGFWGDAWSVSVALCFSGFMAGLIVYGLGAPLFVGVAFFLGFGVLAQMIICGLRDKSPLEEKGGLSSLVCWTIIAIALLAINVFARDVKRPVNSPLPVVNIQFGRARVIRETMIPHKFMGIVVGVEQELIIALPLKNTGTIKVWLTVGRDRMSAGELPSLFPPEDFCKLCRTLNRRTNFHIGWVMHRSGCWGHRVTDYGSNSILIRDQELNPNRETTIVVRVLRFVDSRDESLKTTVDRVRVYIQSEDKQIYALSECYLPPLPSLPQRSSLSSNLGW